MRIVLDTNVLISGIFWSGPPSDLLDKWRRGQVSLVISPEILDEYKRVGAEISDKIKGIEVNQIINLVAMHSELCAAPALSEQICDDPDDDKFIACAISAGVSHIVTGDKALLRVSGYKGITILKPREILKLLGY